MVCRRVALAALVAAACSSPSARAALTGFGDFSNFAVNQYDSASSPSLTAGMIHITNQSSQESRSVFALTPQDVTHFTASFTYQATGTPTNGFGACFVIQNSGQGSAEVATTSFSSNKFGYGDFSQSFIHSIGVSLEYGSLSSTSSSTGLYTNGLVGGGSMDISPLNPFSGDPINVTLVYNGSLLHETLLDTVTSASFGATYALNIPATVSGSTVYVGVTASSGFNSSVDQYISNFQFTSAVPEPATAGVIAIGGLLLMRRRK
ncbi:MAG TPA: PEP-CTERM sorting domain-containing protein [Bryobacteraceae bacterium]|jgi:hypothetical protein